MRNRLAVMVLAVGLLAASGVLASKIGSEFLPELNEGALYVTFTLPSNTSLTEGGRLPPFTRAIVARTPEVTEQLTQLGRPEDGTDPTLPNNLELFVKLKPMAAWRPSVRSIEDL